MLSFEIKFFFQKKKLLIKTVKPCKPNLQFYPKNNLLFGFISDRKSSWNISRSKRKSFGNQRGALLNRKNLEPNGQTPYKRRHFEKRHLKRRHFKRRHFEKRHFKRNFKISRSNQNRDERMEIATLHVLEIFQMSLRPAKCRHQRI